MMAQQLFAESVNLFHQHFAVSGRFLSRRKQTLALDGLTHGIHVGGGTCKQDLLGGGELASLRKLEMW